ncbi:MAG: antirestriction protein [Nitrospirae bacterium]|nr:antirestriction protein [Nitrospirota bacterium]
MKVKEALSVILERFESGDIPEAVALSCYPPADIPLAKWSLLNKLLAYFSGTQDARGIRQWNKIGRYPRKGSRAIHILAPIVKKDKDENDDEKVVRGFMLVPVFRVEDTDGIPVDYTELIVPELPLLKRAAEWGISVRAVAKSPYFYGAYSQGRKEIVLASPEESVFFHELCHCAHHRIKGKLTPGQDWRQEIVAELGAIVLCKLIGKEADKALGNGYRYITRYAEETKISPYAAAMRVLGDTEQVLGLILAQGHE